VADVTEIDTTPDILPLSMNEPTTFSPSSLFQADTTTEALILNGTEAEETAEEETATDEEPDASMEEELPIDSTLQDGMVDDHPYVATNLLNNNNLQVALKNSFLRNALPEIMAIADPALAESLELTTLAAEIRSVLTSGDFNDDLDRVRKDMADMTLLHRAMIGSTAAVTTSMSVGYVAWLIRGGVLMSTMLSSLPAWQIIDPLPVLARTRGDDDQEVSDEDSLQSIIQKQSVKADMTPEEPSLGGKAEGSAEMKRDHHD
jgi:hypothetical protein